MKYLNEIINVLGMKTIIIISVSILVLILVILTYRLLKLKHYRNEIVDLENNHPFHLVIAISVVFIILMCPCMSFAATLLFKNAGSQIIAVWLQTTVLNFPMAFFLQLCFAGPIVRFVFGKIFRENRA